MISFLCFFFTLFWISLFCFSMQYSGVRFGNISKWNRAEYSNMRHRRLPSAFSIAVHFPELQLGCGESLCEPSLLR